MPPRKSVDGSASKATAGGESASAAAVTTPTAAAAGGEEVSGTTPSKEKEKEKEKDGVNVEELGLPRTMVQRLAKGVLPPNTQIQKDAMLAMSKSATVFVSYLSSHANEMAMDENKKTIMLQNVYDALADLEFSDFLPRLEAEVAKFTEHQTEKRNNYRKKLADKAAPTNGAASSPKVATNGRANDDEGDQPAAKKARRSTFGTTVATDTDEPQGGSGDDTVSEAEGDEEANADEGEESEEEVEEVAEDEPVAEDSLETREVEEPEEDPSENSEESD
ncbi:MAG: hypothetical protein M4579_002606 [Chaenotheca gracillima]|nr:MAG: hypothetical protein M4579_002606 [Chaenotheca gracillima]